MNRHSFWCFIDKTGVCDCGYAELLEARHLLLELYKQDITFSNPYLGNTCLFCREERVCDFKYIPEQHDESCIFQKLHIYLEKNNAF